MPNMRSMERVISLTPIASLQVQGKVILRKAIIVYSRKSPFGFDDSVPGSPASRAGTSPRYSEVISLIISQDTTLSVPLTEVLPNKKPSQDLIP
jgi:hypothetical protein